MERSNTKQSAGCHCYAFDERANVTQLSLGRFVRSMSAERRSRRS